MSQVREVNITSGDTLAGIVNRELGGLGQLHEVVALNKLRPPFISNSPLDDYGPAVATTNLSASLAVGSTSLDLSSFLAAHVGYILLLHQYTNAGAENWAVLPILSLSGARLATFPATTILFNSGALVYLCLNPTGRGRVLVVGDRLLLPTPNSGGGGLLLDDARRMFGVDLKLGSNARRDSDPGYDLELDSYGDLATVAGRDNLKQAVAGWLQTMTGEDPYCPDYGVTLPELIGQTASPELVGLYMARLRLELLSDPRVAQVVDATARFSGTALMVSVTIEPQGATNQLLVIDVELTT